MELDAQEEDVEPEKSSSLPAWMQNAKAKKAEEERQWKRREHKRVQETYQQRLSGLRRAIEDKLELEKTGLKEPASKRSKSVGLALSRAVSASVSEQPSPSPSDIETKRSGEDYYLLKDYESDSEKQQNGLDDLEPLQKGKNTSPTKALLKAARKTQEEQDLEEYPTRKIFFCSRTHSQLSQFVHEVRKTFWSNSVRLVVLGSRKTMCVNPNVNSLPTINQINDKCLDLVGSKPTALKGEKEFLTKLTRIQAPEPNAAFGMVPDEEQPTMCKFLHTQRQYIFRDHLLARPLDIEEMVGLGKSGEECPYFATRSSIRHAELVVLPYNTLLHEDTRKALGIDLRGQIVIMDESHNLIDTVNAIHSVELTLSKATQALSQLNLYYEKYIARLKAKNVVYIEKIQSILRSIIKYLDPSPKHSSSNSNATQSSTPKSTINPSTIPRKSNDFGSEFSASIVQLNDFLFDSRLDTHNLYKIEKYMKESGIIHKVQGFCKSAEVEITDMKARKTTKIQVEETEFEKHRPALGIVASFLATLMTQSKDCCLLVSRHSTNIKLSSLKYILLNPELQFQTILKDARSVILAGGTLQPFGDFYQHLLSPSSLTPPITSEISRESSTPIDSKEKQEAKSEENLKGRVQTFTCTHIIPDENLVTLVVPSGPTEVNFTFNFENRSKNDEMFDELSILFSNLCNIVPDGIVLFSPSYQFEESLMAHWKLKGFYSTIDAKKKIFREPRTTAGVEGVLADYESAISMNTGEAKFPNGAILSCVVGGKLSEGINFKDHLGRCVVVLGLPYPNAKDPVLMQRLAHIDHKAKFASSQGGSAEGGSKVEAATSSEYYENLCMKAVNQSIGRSIRHIGDYSTILLVDSRYSRPSIQEKLPEWIFKRIAPTNSFGDVSRQLGKFFHGKQSNQKDIMESRKSRTLG